MANRKSLLQQYVDENGMEGLNEKYVEKALAHNGGFGPDYGDPAEQNSKFREAAARINSGERTSKDDFIHTYIATRVNGGSPEEATDAARKAAGYQTPASYQSGTNYAIENGDAYYDEETGRIRLYDSVNKAVGNRRYEDYVRETTPEQRYAARVKQAEAVQTPLYSQTASPEPTNQPTAEEQYVNQAMNEDAAKQATAKRVSFLGTLKDIITTGSGDFLQGGGRNTNWGAAIPSGNASGGDGALKQSLADQTGESGVNAEQAKKNPLTGVTKVSAATLQETGRPEQSQITQYFWPEDENAMIRYQSNAPFEEYQRILIDEMNAAYDAQDFERGNELRKIYSDKDDSYNAFLRDRYQQTLPKGESAYKSLQDAISAGDVRAYNEAQNTLASNGYSRKDIEEQASEMIHNSNKSSDEKEKELKKYLGLSDSDAQATTLMWWWTDNKGKEAADADKNGRLKQDELGAYLKELEESKTLTEAQAAAIWQETYPTAKTDYSKWKGNSSKPNNPVLTAADADGNGRLKQDELGAYLKQQEAGGMSEEEAADIWKEQFPTAKTDYAKWKGKQKK